MYNNELYADGTTSVLKVKWCLKCQTPLAIRNGLSIQYEDKASQASKLRGQNLKWTWQSEAAGGNEVAALAYGYRIHNDGDEAKVESYHSVPASTIRGALRSWTIKHLVDPSFRDKFVAPSQEKDGGTDIDKENFVEESRAYVTKVMEALNEKKHGYELIASLFGMALETREEERGLSNAGRLQIATVPFTHAQPQPIQANGSVANGFAGPGNAKRQMSVRNPLDRITHAAKDGGLHQFLEFCAGESFDVFFTVRNPLPEDLALFWLWQRELNDGLLRIGALSSIGRGRVFVDDAQYDLWVLIGKPALAHFEDAEVDGAASDDDVLSGLWRRLTLSPSYLSQFEEELIQHVQ